MGSDTYRKYQRERDECLLKLSKYEAGTKPDIGGNPVFLFSGEVRNEELYDYLKKHPEHSDYLFRKYSANQEFIKSLTDPSSPLYLEKVKKNLSERLKVEDLGRELQKLREQIRQAQDDLDSLPDIQPGEIPDIDNAGGLRQQIDVATRKLDELISDVSRERAELNSLTNEAALLKSDTGMSLFTKLIDSVRAIRSAVDRMDVGILMSTSGDNIYKIDRNLIANLWINASNITEISSKGNPFSRLNIDHLKSQAIVEYEQAKNSLDAIRGKNWTKKSLILQKSFRDIYLEAGEKGVIHFTNFIDQFQRSDEIIGDLVSITSREEKEKDNKVGIKKEHTASPNADSFGLLSALSDSIEADLGEERVPDKKGLFGRRSK